MALSKIRIGEYIELHKEKCNIANLTLDEVSGVNREKEFFEPSKQISKDTSDYKVVPSLAFACNLMHIGRDVVLPIAINRTTKNKIVSPAYTVFKLINEETILREYLFILLNSSEMDRYFWFHCDSSVRDGMEWNSFCDIELEVPSIEIQKKYVAIYEGLLANLHSYEKGLDDLKLVCDGYIENLRKNYKDESIGKYIIDTCIKNTDNKLSIVGISNTQKLIPSESRTSGVDKLKYYLLKSKEFAYSPIHINDGSIAFNSTNKNYIVSPIYRTFKTINEDILYSNYLMLWFARNEFKRSCKFYAFGSARDSFEWNQMKEVKIPIPNINIQKCIAEVFEILNYRKNNLEKLKEKIKNICPILVRGSIEEANRG